MKRRLQRYWNEFKSVPPGRRFQHRHARRRAHRSSTPWLNRCWTWGGGIVLILIGAFFAIFPGPGIPFLLFGGALLAGESRVVARFLDGCDVAVRRVAAWGRRTWRNLSLLPRAGVVLAVATVSAGVAYAGIRVLLDRV